MWYVYILRCNDDTLYTGVTTDLVRRVEEHNSSALGAKYTRCRRPVELAYSCEFENRSSACKEEARIKGLTREEKVFLIEPKQSLSILVNGIEEENLHGEVDTGDVVGNEG